MLINSPNISGSLTVTGNSVITGSLTVLGGINGAITGSATTASYVEYSNVADKPALVSGSSQVTYSGLTGIPSGIVSGSSQITYSGLTGIPSGIVSGSAQIADFGIFATTGSNGFNGSQSITGSLTVTGQVVAQTLNVQQVTSSIVYSSGSNVFGNELGNTQQFTGSVSITGSLNTSIAAFGSAATIFLTSDGGVIKSRTAAQTLSDIAALPLAGGTLTGALNGTSATFSGGNYINGTFQRNAGNGSLIEFKNYAITTQYNWFVGCSYNNSNVFEVIPSTDAGNDSPSGTSVLSIASTGAATFSSNVTAVGLFSTTSASGTLSAKIRNDITAASGSTGYGLAIESEASAATSYALTVRNLAESTTYFHISTETGKVGNVGIGNTEPLEQLHLKDPNKNPSIRIDHAGGGSTFMKFQQFPGWNASMTFTSAFNYMGIDVTIPLVLNQNGSNVLIGTTTNASGKLQVLGADNAIISQIKSASGMLQFYSYYSPFDTAIIQALDGGGVNYKNLRIEATSTTFSSSVTAGGTLTGGGTNYLVNTSTGTNPVYQRILTTGGDVIFGIASSTGSSLLPGVGNYATVLYNNTNTDISFGTNQLLRMTITSAGNFDYGGLNIQSSNNATYRQAFYGAMSIMWRNAEDFYIDSNHTFSSSNTNVASYTSANGIGRLGIAGGEFSWLTYNGSVTAGSAYALTARFLISKAGIITSLATYNNTTAAAANVQIDSNGYFARSTSSSKYKTDITNYTKGLNEVLGLRPVFYKGKTDGDTQFAGLIAEEVHELGLTEFVQYTPDGSPDALAYQNMVALLVKAIQELKAENDTLKSRIDTLEQA